MNTDTTGEEIWGPQTPRLATGGSYKETSETLAGALPIDVATLVWLERLIYIVAVNGPDIQMRARQALSKLSRVLAESQGALVDAYSLTDAALTQAAYVLRAGQIGFYRFLAIACVVLAVTCGPFSLAFGFAAAVAAIPLLALATHDRAVERATWSRISSNRKQLAEFAGLVRWLGFEPGNLSAMKHTLQDWHSWDSLRHDIDEMLKHRALHILGWKEAKVSENFTEEEKNGRVREAEDNFFPFHRRLAACGLVDPKVDGYFDWAKEQHRKMVHPAPAAA